MARLLLAALCISLVLAGPTPVLSSCPADSDLIGPAVGDFCPAGATVSNGNCCLVRPKTTCPSGYTSIGAAVAESCPAGAKHIDGACCL